MTPDTTIDVLPYASDSWDRIVRDARRVATRQGLIAGFWGFIVVLLLGLLIASLFFGTRLAAVAGLLILASLFLVPAALAALTYLGAYRLTIEARCRTARVCSKCGYDLRASEGRCPECGAPIHGAVTPQPA